MIVDQLMLVVAVVAGSFAIFFYKKIEKTCVSKFCQKKGADRHNQRKDGGGMSTKNPL
jgi:hypothetical protein